MSRPDLGSHTEGDAGAYDRAQAYPDEPDADFDLPNDQPIDAQHTCTSPDVEKCLLCVLEAVVAEMRAENGLRS